MSDKKTRRKRLAKPWYWKARGKWYVTIAGEQIALHEREEKAWIEYGKIMEEHGEKAAERMSEVAAPPSRPDKMTIGELVMRFLAWTKANQSPRTCEWYKERLDSWLKTLPEGLRASAIKPYHVQQWYDNPPASRNRYKLKEWSPGQKANAIRAVQRIFNWGVELELVASNPVGKMKKPKGARRTFIFTDEHMKEMLRRTPDEEFRNVLTFLFATGCRVEEIRRVEALQCVEEYSAWKFIGKRDRLRIIYIPKRLRKTVERMAAEHPEGPLFRNTHGGAWTASALTLRMNRLRDAMKLPKGACGVAIRHSFCTRNLEDGMDAVTLSRLMGHADTRMVDQVYSHLSQEHLRKAAEKASR